MPHILIVDDSAVERRIVSSLIETRTNLTPIEVDNARSALSLISENQPELIITDLMMPDMDGMSLVDEITNSYPGLPVIMMTAYGNEDIVVNALRKGAASYVTKQALTSDLIPTVTEVLQMTKAGRQERQILEYLEHTEHRFVLGNDLELVMALVGYLQSMLNRRRFCDETSLVQAGIALCEALMNALYHGNLELDSSLRETGGRDFESAARTRSLQPPFKDRKLHVTVQISSTAAVYTVRDEGPGFDPTALPDPKAHDNLEKLSGRGLLLINTFMDAVTFNDDGNEIQMTLEKR